MKNIYLFICLASVLLIGCKSYLDKRARQKYEENSLEWYYSFDSLGCYEMRDINGFAFSGYIPIRDQGVTCCLIDSIRNGGLEQIAFMKDLILKKTPKSSACHCKESRRYCVFGKELFEAQLQLLQNDKFFECREGMHNQLYCPAKTQVTELLSAIKPYPNQPYILERFFHYLDLEKDDICECKKYKSIYRKIKKQYFKNEIELNAK